jgi:hypothetical protein
VKIEKILFIGGDLIRFASVQIRCQDIASRLGCDSILTVRKAEDVPSGYSAFVCVTACLNQEDVLKLATRGPVIWDVIDTYPPKHGVSIYLTSTERAKHVFHNYGRVENIPHHHCNFSGVPNSQECRRPGWIGNLPWYPKLEGCDHDFYNVRKMSGNDVADAYRRIGIGLNLRSKRPDSDFHAEINSGIKLINCIGFGIPSVSSDEPGYHEVGEDCTIFSDLDGYLHWVHLLQNDEQLYHKIRQNCLRASSKFHISSILCQYCALIESL